MAEQGQSGPVCTHGPAALDPVGVCQGCRDEQPTCLVVGCGATPYLGARGRKVGLCFDHYVDASEQEERNWDLQRERATASAERALVDAQRAQDRGGA